MNSTTNLPTVLPLWRYVWYCHGLPERSLRWSGKILPICARCTGLWIGYAIGAALVWFFIFPWWISLILIAPLAIDGGTQAIQLRHSNNNLRLITGVCAGVGEIMFLVVALSYSFMFGRLAGYSLMN
ncbi:MAG: hypothetical protein ACD_43C00087G0002 [uncultured bacterium]|nr:MAG: hypothetical protein ACD_43C00087G0002 [uncultured bacterium]